MNENEHPAANGSALRGLLIGLPLSLLVGLILAGIIVACIRWVVVTEVIGAVAGVGFLWKAWKARR